MLRKMQMNGPVRQRKQRTKEGRKRKEEKDTKEEL